VLAFTAGCRAARTVFDLRPLEMNDEPFLSQLSVLMHASVLCGVHGAGLANIAWLRPGRGALVEVQHNAGGNHHYQQMATWLGHDYRRAPAPPLPAAAAAAAVAATPRLTLPALNVHTS